MSSVTRRISEIKQPRGGFIKPSQFKSCTFNDQCTLNESENIHAFIIGLVVDYMTRLEMGAEASEAFKISCLGAKRAEQRFQQENAIKTSLNLLERIKAKSLDEESIVSACKLVTYDTWLRNPLAALMAKESDEINPNKETVQNIKTMVERSLRFWKEFGPILKVGFTFKPDGYTATVTSGDGDYLTDDTIWDFKVSKSKPTSKHTLQLLMYWIMGQHSGQAIFKNIRNLGIYNPRLNTVYLLNMSNVSEETIKEVERNVICY